MKVLKDFLGSEKGVFCLGLIAAASVLTGLGHMSIDAWQAYTQVLACIYVGGKAVQGVGSAIANGKGGKIDVAARKSLDVLEKRLGDTDAKIDAMIAEKDSANNG